MIEQFTNEQIIHFIADDFASSNGSSDLQAELCLERIKERNGFDLRDYKKLPKKRREEITQSLLRIFVRKHEGQFERDSKRLIIPSPDEAEALLLEQIYEVINEMRRISRRS